MVDLEKILLSSSLIAMENLVAVSHTVRAYIGGLENLADAGTPPHLDGRG